jgi:hypothetical protein
MTDDGLWFYEFYQKLQYLIMNTFYLMSLDSSSHTTSPCAKVYSRTLLLRRSKVKSSLHKGIMVTHGEVCLSEFDLTVTIMSWRYRC